MAYSAVLLFACDNPLVSDIYTLNLIIIIIQSADFLESAGSVQSHCFFIEAGNLYAHGFKGVAALVHGQLYNLLAVASSLIMREHAYTEKEDPVSVQCDVEQSHRFVIAFSHSQKVLCKLLLCGLQECKCF